MCPTIINEMALPPRSSSDRRHPINAFNLIRLYNTSVLKVAEAAAIMIT